MPEFEITSPYGRTYVVEGPSEPSEEQVRSILQRISQQESESSGAADAGRKQAATIERAAQMEQKDEMTFDFSEELNRQGVLYNLAFGATARGVFERMKPGESTKFALPGGKAISITKKDEKRFISPDYLQYLKDEAPVEAFTSEALKNVPGSAAALAAASAVSPGAKKIGAALEAVPFPATKVAGKAVKYGAPLAAGVLTALTSRLAQDTAVEELAPEMIKDIYEGGDRSARLSPGGAALGAAASQLPMVGPGVMAGTGLLTNVVSGGIGGALDLGSQLISDGDVDLGRTAGVAAISAVLGKPTTLGKKVAPNLANQGSLAAKQSKENGLVDLQSKLNQTQPVQLPPPEISTAVPATPEIVPVPSRTPLVPYERTTEIPRELEIMDIVRRDLDDASINAGLEAAKRNELAIEAERRAKYLSDAAKTRGVRYQYSVFQPGNGRPPVVQVDAIAPDGSASLASGTIDEFRAAGARLPDVPEDIPQGRYTTEQVEGFVKPATDVPGWSRMQSETGSILVPGGNPQVKTKEFRDWFGSSLGVNESGEPVVYYHGTSKDADFKEFKTGSRGAFFTRDPKSASTYSMENDSMRNEYVPGSGGMKFVPKNTASRVFPVYLKYENPYRFSALEVEEYRNAKNYAAFQKKIAEKAKRAGHDSIIYPEGSIVVFNPTQIKSAIANRGTFSGTKKDIAAFTRPDVMLDIASAGSGATIGGVVGYSTGDTPEEKVRRGLTGASIGLGAAGGARALSRLKTGAPPPTKSRDIAALDSMMTPDEKTSKPIGQRISEAINRVRTAMNTSRGWIGYAQREITGKTPGPGQNLERAAEQLAGSPVRAQYAVEPLFKIVEDLTPDDVHNLNRLILAKRIEARLAKIPEDLAKVQDAVGRAQAEFDAADAAWKQGKSLEAASVRSKAKKNLDEAIEDLNEFRSTKEVAGWELDPATTKNNPAKAIADLEAEIGPERAAILNRKLEEYSEQMRGVLASRVESGLLSPESARQIAESADFYAPFKVLKYFDEQKGAYTDGRSTFTQGRLIRKLTGMREEDTKIADVLTASAEQLYRNSIQNDKNRFMRRLATLTRLDKEGKWLKQINEGDKLPDGFETVPYFVRGERRLLGVDKRLFESLSSASGTLVDNSMLLSGLGAFSSAFKAGATTLSIPFLIANATLRDPLRLSIISKAGVKNPKDFATLALVDYPMALIDSLSAVLGRPTRMGEVWLSSGAANATFSRSLTPTAFKSKIPRERSLLDIATEAHFGIKPATNLALSVGNVFEQLPKIAGMRRMMREAGIVPPQTVVVRKGGVAKPGDITPPPFRGAAINVMTGEGAVQNQRQWEDMVTEVRNYAGSPDFQRFGSKMAILNVLMPFSNARWQGISQDAARLAALNTPEGRAAAVRLFGAIAIPAATLAWWNMQPENEEDYNRLSPRDKQNKFNIPLYEAADGSGTPFPFRKNPDGSYAENKPLYYVTKQGEKMRRYFSVPRYEAPALAANVMESFVKFTKDNDPEAFSKLGDVFISGALPITISGDTPEQRALSTISGLNPMLRVPLEQAFNTAAYTGKDIVPDWKKGAHPVDQFDPNYTPQAYRDLANRISGVTGLTGESLAGQVFTSPARLQHMAEGFTGGLTKSFTVMPGEEGTNPIVSRLEKMWRPSEFSDATEERKAARLAMADKTSEASRRNEAVVDVLRSARKELVAAMRSSQGVSPEGANAILTTTSIPMVQKFVDDGLLNRDDVRKIERGLMDLANGMTPVEAFVKNNVDSKARPAYYVRLIKSGVVKDPYAYLSRELQIGNLTSENFPLLSQELEKAGITIEPPKENNP